MARLFNQGSNEYLQTDQAPVTAEPLTMACWFYTLDDSLTQILMWIGDKDAGNNQHHDIFLETDLEVKAFSKDTSSATASTSTNWAQDQWHHACGVFAADNDRRAFLDGGGKGTNSTSRSPVGWDRTTIAQLGGIGVSFDGYIAEAAIWNAALSDDEVDILGKGYSPLFVRPQNLVAYWPLIRDENQDKVGGYDLTAFNTPSIAPHPPIIYPAPPIFYPAATIIAAGQPMNLRATTIPGMRQWQPRIGP